MVLSNCFSYVVLFGANTDAYMNKVRICPGKGQFRLDPIPLGRKYANAAPLLPRR